MKLTIAIVAVVLAASAAQAQQWTYTREQVLQYAPQAQHWTEAQWRKFDRDARPTKHSVLGNAWRPVSWHMGQACADNPKRGAPKACASEGAEGTEHEVKIETGARAPSRREASPDDGQPHREV